MKKTALVYRLLIGFISLTLVLFLIRPQEVFGVLTGCTAGNDPGVGNVVETNSSTNLSFVVTNNDTTSSVSWVRFTAPSGDYTVTGGGSSGWSANVESTTTISFTGGTISPNSTQYYTVSVSSGPTAVGSGTWGVQASDLGSSSDAISCGGSATSSITEIDQQPPVISGLVVTDITSSSARIIWNTNETADSEVEYGVTADYGLYTNDGNFVTSHSITISGLASSITYHYKVTSSDPLGNGAVTADNVFTTAALGSATSSQVATNITTTTVSKKDATAPSFSLYTNLSKIYKTAPAISGKASDDTGITTVEYSTDEGVSWSFASVKNKGAKEVNFNFSLGVLDDGNYTFLVRAKDANGNVSESKSYTLVIDRLPPQVGTVVVSSGPQVISLSKEGLLVTVAGVEQKVTLSAVGGPTSLEVDTGQKKFNLQRNSESGLWSGFLKFDNPGLYEITTKSLDGAKNETVQTLAKVFVQEKGKISYSGKAVQGAEVSIYVFEPTLGEYIRWDGAAYGQFNPQKTDENGNYSLFLPSGRYYLEVKVLGFIKYRTQIFDLKVASPVNADLSSGILTIPFVAKEIKVNPTKSLPKETVSESNLVDQSFPIDLSSKAYLVSVLTTWLPDSAQQAQILQNLNPDGFGVAVLVPQESESTVEIFKKRGRYNLDFLTDPDGKFVEPLFLRFLPVHFFLDKNGKIKNKVFGVLSQEELLENLSQ